MNTKTCVSRLVLTALVLGCWAINASPEETFEETRRPSLVDLPGVGVVIEIESLSQAAKSGGLHKTTLQTDVELQLRLAGIPVLTKLERLKTAGMPFLYLNVAVIEHIDKKGVSFGWYSYTLELELHQRVKLLRLPTSPPSWATTWKTPGTIGIVPAGEMPRVIRQVVRDQVNEFINAYLAVNPPQAPVPSKIDELIEILGKKRRQRVPAAVMERQQTKVCEACLHVETKMLKDWVSTEKDPVTGYKCPACGALKMRQEMKCPHCGTIIPTQPRWGADQPPTPERPTGEPPHPPKHPAYKCPKCGNQIVRAQP